MDLSLKDLNVPKNIIKAKIAFDNYNNVETKKIYDNRNYIE